MRWVRVGIVYIVTSDTDVCSIGVWDYLCIREGDINCNNA